MEKPLWPKMILVHFHNAKKSMMGGCYLTRGLMTFTPVAGWTYTGMALGCHQAVLSNAAGKGCGLWSQEEPCLHPACILLAWGHVWRSWVHQHPHTRLQRKQLSCLQWGTKGGRGHREGKKTPLQGVLNPNCCGESWGSPRNPSSSSSRSPSTLWPLAACTMPQHGATCPHVASAKPLRVTGLRVPPPVSHQTQSKHTLLLCAALPDTPATLFPQIKSGKYRG